MAKSKPLRPGVIGGEGTFNEIPLDFSKAIAPLKNLADEQVQKKAVRSLKMACRFFVSRRRNEVPVSVFRSEIKKLAKALATLEKRISELSDFARSEIYIDENGMYGGLELLEKRMPLIRGRLAEIQKQEKQQGSDYIDPAGSQFVRDLLGIYMSLTKRAKPPSIKFDGRSYSSKPDDVSSHEFGQFILDVEDVVRDGLKIAGKKNPEAYNLRNKRAAIRGAITDARSRSP